MGWRIMSQLKMLMPVGNLWMLIIWFLKVTSLTNSMAQIMQATFLCFFLICTDNFILELNDRVQWLHLFFWLSENDESSLCIFFIWKLSLCSFLNLFGHRVHGTVLFGLVWSGPSLVASLMKSAAFVVPSSLEVFDDVGVSSGS